MESVLAWIIAPSFRAAVTCASTRASCILRRVYAAPTAAKPIMAMMTRRTVCADTLPSDANSPKVKPEASVITATRAVTEGLANTAESMGTTDSTPT